MPNKIGDSLRVYDPRINSSPNRLEALCTVNSKPNIFFFMIDWIVASINKKANIDNKIYKKNFLNFESKFKYLKNIIEKSGNLKKKIELIKDFWEAKEINPTTKIYAVKINKNRKILFEKSLWISLIELLKKYINIEIRIINSGNNGPEINAAGKDNNNILCKSFKFILIVWFD